MCAEVPDCMGDKYGERWLLLLSLLLLWKVDLGNY